MVEIYKRNHLISTQIDERSKRHLMPTSLRYIKILSAAGIDWSKLHIIDAFSLVCAINIETARQYLKSRAREKMNKAGVQNISPARESDFNAL